jgi:lysophospholipase L1-like esterase
VPGGSADAWPDRYAVLGDSYCAGLVADTFLPWPRLVAAELGGGTSTPELVALARHGATSADVLRDQLPPALAAAAELITVSCGANDVLMAVVPDIDAYGRNLTALLAALQGAKPDACLLTVTYGEFANYMPYRARSRSRVATGMDAVNEQIRSVSRAAGCPCVDIAALPEGRRADSFGDDGIHASALGHTRTAAAVLSVVAAHD